MRRPPTRRSAVTLVELVLGMTVMSIVLGGMASAIVIAGRAVDDGTLPETRVAESADQVGEIAAEVNFALEFLELTDNAITFTIPDRDGDFIPEKIRYAWSGTPGDPVTREWNDSAAITWITQVDAFNIQHLKRTLTPPPQACCTLGQCTEVTMETCARGGGEAMGEGSLCATTVCPGCFTDVSVQVIAGIDDAEEVNLGKVIYLDSSDLELATDSIFIQTIGIRFPQIDIPQGSKIKDAFIDFTADGSESGVCTLTIQGQAADDAAAFTTDAGDISGRPRTIAAVPWVPAPWTGGSQYTSPDLKLVVQEIVDRSGWAELNDMVFIITGAGLRRAYAFDGAPALAPVLRITCDDSPIKIPEIE